MERYFFGAMTSRPTITETLQNGEAHALRESPENLSSRKRILYEIENLLSMEEHGLELEALNKTSGRVSVTNRALYKMYKALQKELQVQPAFVYTGNNVIPVERARVMAEEHGKNIEELELTL